MCNELSPRIKYDGLYNPAILSPINTVRGAHNKLTVDHTVIMHKNKFNHENIPNLIA